MIGGKYMENLKIRPVSCEVFQSIGSPILVIDPQTAEILDVNEAACKFYGYPPDVFLQKKIVDLAAIPAGEAWERFHTTESSEITNISVPHRLANGEVRDVEVNLKNCILEDNPVKVATIHDLTIQKRIMHKLQKRIKELNAFYAITSIYEEEGLKVEQIYKRITDELPESWQYPEIACGRIMINEHLFATTNFKETAWRLAAPIKINNTMVGSVEIGYLTECPPEDEGPFLKEERLLLNAVAERLGKITKHLQIEKNLQESEERYRLLFDNMSEGFSLCEVLKDSNGNPVDARILAVNAAFESHTGFKPAAVIGKTILEVTPQLEMRSLESYFKVAQTGESYSSEHFSNLFQRYIRTRVFRPQPGKFATIFEDVTNRKLAEETLRASEEKIRLVLENSHDGINMLDLKTGKYVFFNHAQVQLTGFTAQELEQMSDKEATERVHPEDREVSAEQKRRITAGEAAPVTSEYRWKIKTGEYRWFSDTRTPVQDETGQTIALVGISRDITVEKEAQKKLLESNIALEKALRAKNEFMAAMSHELRTPLNGIISTAELLQFITSDKLNDKQLKHMANVEQSGRRLLDTVNDILEFTQIQAGTYQLEEYPCMLTEVCEVALQKFVPRAAGKNQQIKSSVKPDNIHIQTDPICLHKILYQLLDNASKFTQMGGEFGIDITGREDAKLVDISVWDTGIGIAEENFERLFMPFAQLDARLAREFEGTGLGLALAKGLTELLGGVVTIQSTLGKGSRFTVTLPWSEVGR